MAQPSLASRTAEYVDHDIRYVDINKCVPGGHARAIKPGGIEQITNSIREDGYKRVPHNSSYSINEYFSYTHTHTLIIIPYVLL